MNSNLQAGRKSLGGARVIFTKQGKQRLICFIVVVVLVVSAFGTSKYIEFNTAYPWDGAAFVYSAQHILNGAEIGVDERPTALVGTLLVNILGVWLFGFNDLGPILLQMILQIFALVTMFFAIRKLFGNMASAVSVVVASVYLSAPLIAKDGLKEQFMIAFMVLGVSCFVLGQLGGRWWWCVLAGAFAALGPLFKATGISAIVAIGLFVIVQPLLKHRTWGQTGRDILLLFVGAGLTLAPIYIWLVKVNAPKSYWPYSFAWNILMASEGPKLGSYVANSREVCPIIRQLPDVLRYYRKLRLPILLAAAAIIARLIRLNSSWLGRLKEERKTIYDRFVLLFGVWWVLDMVFVWISPRSYGHYYLPLNASAAMLSGYVVALYCDKAVMDKNKVRWKRIGLIGLICMLALSWSVFKNYARKLQETIDIQRNSLKDSWEVVGEYIRKNSSRNDKIYVWGWLPGIYVKAQRFSPVPRACIANMHIFRPETLSAMVTEMLEVLEEDKPKFIVDTRKIDFPGDRPPLELWPKTPGGFILMDQKQIQTYDVAHSELLAEKFGQDEALRYKAMAPFRKFVMKNYKIVPGSFGEHILFELKAAPQSD
jgi:hypothetical protein